MSENRGYVYRVRRRLSNGKELDVLEFKSLVSAGIEQRAQERLLPVSTEVWVERALLGAWERVEQ